MSENRTPSVCLLLSPPELGLLRALLMEHPHNEAAQVLLRRLDAVESSAFLTTLSRALSHAGLADFSKH